MLSPKHFKGLSAGCAFALLAPFAAHSDITVHSVTEEQTLNPATNLFDGNTADNSRWSASGFPQTVVIDYGEAKFFHETKVSTYRDRAYQYTISASDSPDSGFLQIVDRSSNQENGVMISDTFDVVRARYLKVTVIDAAASYTGSWVSLTEVAITEGSSTGNMAPQVDAGEDLSVDGEPIGHYLDATVYDDGLPDTNLTYHWEKISGWADIWLDDTDQEDAWIQPGINSSGANTYRLSVSDGELTNWDDVTVTVNELVNEAPIVDAGEDQTVTWPDNSVQLTASVSDDDLPYQYVYYTWRKTSGPGTVIFSDEYWVQTTVTFSTPGVYVIEF